MTAPLAEASVKAVLDFADIDRDFGRRLDAATKRATSVVEKNLGGVTKAAKSTTDSVNKAFGGVDLGGVTRELGQVRTATDQTAAAADRNADAQQRMNRSMDPDRTSKLGGAMGFLGGRLAVAASGLGGLVAIGAGLSKSISIGLDYTSTMNTLGAVTQATSDQMAAAGQRAQELGNDITLPATSAVDAAAAMTELAKGGLSVEQSMTAAKGTLQLAAAAQIDAATAATIQANALNTFALSGENAGRVADILANTANASSAEITDVAFALQAGGAVASQFGLSIEDTAAAIGVFANNGIAGSDAGTLLKSALLALTDQGEPAQGAIADLGLEVYDAQGQFVGLRALMDQLGDAAKTMTPEMYQAATNTLFGSDAARLAGIAAKEGAAGFDTMLTAVQREGAAADVAAAKTAGLPGGMQALQNAAETAALQIFDLIDGPLDAFVRGAADFVTTWTPRLIDAVHAVGDAFVATKQWIEDNRVLLLGIATVIATVLGPGLLVLSARFVIFQTAAVAVRLFNAAVAAGRIIMIGFNAIMAANPIGLVATAIAALVAGLVYFFTQTETGKQLWDTIWNAMKDTVITVWGYIQGAISVAWNIIQGIFTALKIAFAIVATALLLSYETFIKPVFEQFAAIAQWTWETVLQPVWELIKTGFSTVGDLFMAVWNTLIKPAWDALTLGIQAGWQLVVMPVFDALKIGLGAVGDFFDWVWNTRIKPLWDALGAGLKLVNDTVIQPVWEAIKTGLGFVRTAFEEAVGFIGQVWETIRGIVAKPIAFVIQSVYNEGIREAWNRVAGWLNLDPLDEYKPAWLAQYMAAGGQVGSRNGPRGDRVPIMGEEGEFMIRRAAAQAIGYDTLAALNQYGVRGYTRGGPVVLDAPPWTGGGGESNLQPAAILARRNIHQYWPEIDTIGGYRASDPFPDHPSGLALDIMTGDPIGTEVNNWLHDQMKALALNYTIWKQFYQPAGGEGNLMEDRGSPTQNHMDHIHALFNANGVPGIGVGGAGGGGGVVQFLRNRVADVFDAIMDPIGAAIPTFPGGQVGEIPRKAFDYMRDKVRGFITGKADTGTPGAPGGGAEQWRDLATQALIHTGFVPAERYIENMLKQIQSESTGNERAIQSVIDVNTGGNEAAGLLQVTPGTFATYRDPTLPDDRFDPFANMVAALNYVRARYGDPNTVWGQGHGYDKGGIATGSGILLKDVIQPERVLDPNTTVIFERFVNLLELFANGNIPAPAQAAPASTTGGGMGSGKNYPAGIAGANQWAADQDFGTKFRAWGTDAAKEITSQFTSPFGLESLSERAIDDLRTAAEALVAAQQQQGTQVTVNVNGAGNPDQVGAAVVDQISERMAPAAVSYRNGG